MQIRPSKSVPSLVFALSCLTALPSLAWDCDHKAERSLSEDLAGIEKVVLKARAGDLSVRVDGTSFRAAGEACASKASVLEGIQLRSERRGEVLTVEVVVPETKGWNQQARLDLDVSLPADMPLDIDDSSGDVTVSGARLGRVEDGSGDLRFQGTHGNLQLEDGSGDVRIDGHHGDVKLKDGSGSIRVTDLDGSVLVDQDGSGDLTMERIAGSVKVEDDGSGDIEVAEVGGDFIVRSAGSGSVRHDGVAGKVDIPARD